MKGLQKKKSLPQKNKNAGMSLLEVVIAVSIFSIVAIVLLQGFVTSSRINRKSNLYLEATSTAQNVMEEIKARPFEEVSLAFNYPIDLTTGESRFAFLNPQKASINNGTLALKEVHKEEDGTYVDVRKYQPADGEDTSKVNASVISKDEGKTFEFNPRKEGKYYFQMENVTNLHEDFDVLVEFDGGKESGYRIKTTTNATEGKNDYNAPNIARLDTKNNAFHIMKKDWANETSWADALDRQLAKAMEFWTRDYDAWRNANTSEGPLDDGTVIQHPTPEEIAEYERNNPKPQRLSYEDINKHARRKLIVTMEKENGIPKIFVKYLICAFDYVKEKGSKYERMSICPCGGKRISELKEGDTFIKNTDCFCSLESMDQEIYTAEADSKLKNMYLFYYPNYNSVNKAEPLDTLEFRNKAGEPIILNFVKQREQDVLLDSSKEKGYHVNVNIREAIDDKNVNWNTNPGLYKAKTKLKSNLDYDISKTEEIDKRERLDQMNLVFYGENRGTEKKVSRQAAKNVLSFNGLDDRNVGDRIYLANVKVYRAGEAKNGFSGKPIVTLDGAKEN